MYKVNVQSCNHSNLCEAGQSSKSRWAVMLKGEAEVWENVMPLIMCRDYFNDFLYVQHSEAQELGSIFGFHWKYDQKINDQIMKGDFVPLLFNYTEQSKHSFTNWSALHAIEDSLEFRKTKVVDVELEDSWGNGYAEYKVLEVDPQWFSNSIMLSLYTMLVRFLDYEGNTYQEIMPNVKGTDKSFTRIFDEEEDFTNLTIMLNNWEAILGFYEAQHIDNETDLGDGKIGGSSLVSFIHDGSGIKSMLNAFKNLTGCEPAVREWAETFHNIKKKLNKAA